MAISRRNFLKCAAFTAGGAVLADNPFVKATAKAAMKKDVKYIPSYCEMCFWRCGLVAKVEGGKVVKLEGNPLHPQSRGRLCARGQAGIGLLYDKDRLQTPLIRTGERGDGKYRKASWDEAYSYIAEKLTGIKKKYGPESVALFAHGNGGAYMGNFLEAFGSPNHSHPSYAQCLGAREVAFTLTYGQGPASTAERVDMANSRVIALFGSHMGENMHNSHNQDFVDGLANGAKLIVVDPRYSTAAGKASMWLPIKPGTDLALILAWINIVIQEKWYDREYLEKYATGFDELKEAVKGYTPEWDAKETDLPKQDIIEAIRELGRYKPNVVVHPGRHYSWYGDDTQRGRGLAILNALLGTWGRKGGLWLPPKVNLTKMKETVKYPKPKRESLGFGDYPFASAGITTEVRRATIEGTPYPIKAWFVIGTNLMKTMPVPGKTLEAIKNLDLLVNIDLMPTDMVMMSDVILPSTSYLERHDSLAIVTQKNAGVAIRQPVANPWKNVKPAWLIAKELCNKMGLKKYVEYKTLDEQMRQQAKLWKIDYKKLETTGYIPIPDSYHPYITEKNQPVFATDSKKIELYSEALDEEDMDPVPKYTRHKVPPAGMFRLLYGRSPVHTFSRSMNNKWLYELKSENEVWLSANVARRLGIENGEKVSLVNEKGLKSNVGRVKVTERIREDCVYVIHGFGSTSKRMTLTYGRGIDDAQMMSHYATDPISGTNGMRVNFVKIVKES